MQPQVVRNGYQSEIARFQRDFVNKIPRKTDKTFTVLDGNLRTDLTEPASAPCVDRLDIIIA